MQIMDSDPEQEYTYVVMYYVGSATNPSACYHIFMVKGYYN